MTFSTEGLSKNPNEIPLLMDSIIQAKPVGISAHMVILSLLIYQTVEDKNFVKAEPSQLNARFKENSAVINSNLTILKTIAKTISLKDMESPIIVKSLGGGYDPFNVSNRLAQMTPQRITNRQAYDLVYKSHEDYYKDKRIRVFDPNFTKIEDAIVKQFKNNIDQAIDKSGNSNLVDVRDLDKNSLNIKSWNPSSILPHDFETIQPSKYYKQIPKFTKKLVTDPYGAIVGR